MKRLSFFLFWSLISLQLFSQTDNELFPTLAGLQRTTFHDWLEDCHDSYSTLIMPTDTVEVNNKQYIVFDHSNLGTLLLREENNEVLIYSATYEKDLILYDWSLEKGDSLSRLAIDASLSPVTIDKYTISCITDWGYVEVEENGELTSKKEPLGKIGVSDVSTITLLDGKEYKMWQFDSNDFCIETLGWISSNDSRSGDYFRLIEEDSNIMIPTCYLGEFLVCISRNGQLLYSIDKEKQQNFGSECKCLNNKTLNEDYAPMVVEGYSWNLVYTGADYGVDIETYHTYTEKIEGDSIIDGVVYKKLWEAYDANLENKQFLALIREDITEQKVFAYNDGAEVLLYDLGVEVGDTIRVFDWLHHLKYVNSSNIKEKEEDFSRLIVEEIEFVEDEKYGTLKKVTYHMSDTDFPLKTIIYERYGSTTGWAISNHAMIVGGGPGSMICAFDETGDVVFKRKYTIKGYGEVKDCYVNVEIGSDIETLERENGIYYNSQDGILYVDFAGDGDIVIYDAMGKMVMRKKVDSATKSIPLNLTSGIYIVTSKSQNIHSKIVVK